MLLLTFSVALFIANIYFFVKNKYIYLFIPCLLFLPKYYGIELSPLLPVISVTRIMFILFYIYVFLHKKAILTKSTIFLFFKQKEIYLFFTYFIFRICANAAHISSSDSIKTIFEIIFEQLLFIIGLLLLNLSSKEIEKIIKYIVLSGSIIFIIGSLETIFGIRPFDSLYTISRYIPNEHYIRFGVLRATASLGMPVIFGNYVLLIFPACLYLFEKYKEKKYLICIFAALCGGIHSGSRSTLIFISFISVFYFLFLLSTKKQRIDFIKHSIIILSSIIATLFVIALFVRPMQFFYINTTKSILNEFGFNYEISSNDNSITMGINDSGAYSRTMQLSGVKYAMSKNPFTGLGTGALVKEGVFYQHKNGRWYPSHTIDIGFVEVIMLEGILGFIGYLAIIIYIYITISKSYSNNKFVRFSLYLTLITYLLSTLCTANIYPILSTFIAFCVSFNKNEFILNDN